MSSPDTGSARLLIIGDDLSGTADCAVTCARHSLTSVVSFGPAPAMDAAQIDVLAIDTDTRRQLPADAARANQEAWHAHSTGRRIYKKIDSTLRGNVAAEVAALASVAGMAVVAPAFPQAGRTTRGARQFVFGMPVEDSEVWRNEGIAGTADLQAMLGAAGLRVATIDLAAVREGAASLQARLSACLVAQWQAVVCDSETDADLACIAAASATLDGVFWVGSAGLAAPLIEVLAARQSEPETTNGSTHRPTPPARAFARCGGTAHPRGVMTVVGSMSSVSHRQVALLRGEAGDSLDLFDVDAADLLDPVSPAALMLTTRVTHSLMRGRHVIVAVSQSRRAAVDDGAHIARQLAERLAPAAAHAGALIATGGETARALLSAMRVNALRVIEEIETGVPLLAAAHAGRTLPVVTKAGGFGQPETLYRAWQRLAAMQQAVAQAPHQSSEEEAMTYRPVIGITMGDAAGVGPEIIMKSLAHASVYDGCRPLVIGDSKRLVDAGQRTGVTLSVRPIASPAEARFQYGEVDCIDLGLIPADLPYGKLSAVAGDAAYQYIARTVELTSAGELDAICTAPLNKEALHAGGHIFPGHTEMLAHLTGIPEVSMMLVAPKLRVIHVTTHIGLLDAIRRIEPGLVQRTIERAHETLVRAGIDEPRIGVCGINPHAGENGLFGYGEEEEKIVPAVAVLRERGWDVEGPLPADTLFFRAGRGDFDVVVAMYHDQGHGPVKVMGLEAGVNVTVGLPVIRTSVDHGTAFDIAGKGIADERSMLEALKQAEDLATRRAVQTA
ncbi:4-hydroxythreonine-4-phosphate dehydrogenase PdxA [Paraburkholderia phenoliruptrix]|uniref:4-hydroxythreonine-4-phosphate dehydrogenase PdxA n=1 Tax=Paraburkholderia phenoliruptrix TaxID=252970 RepID=UPI002869B539|nr:4-hydroxythreonine-4-phosphate dehydrogenase PdxA [Paraburkholderia phenoliruptrix]WMY07026.1 4-hydroxythreonine-4-phosphate dehydrogenase PdxA [Paraburkholderia phenoliruptrix]